MKNLKLLGLLLSLVLVIAGTWTTNDFVYQPSLGARGGEEKSKFDTGLAQVDSHLSKYKTLGDPNYGTLGEALATIGSDEVTLTIPSGTVPVPSNITIPANIYLRVLKGADFQVSSGVTLTINGPIEAGPYQIFSGDGTVALGGVSNIYDVWWATPITDPVGHVAAGIGATFTKTSGQEPIVYVKKTGTGNTGWTGLGAGAGTDNEAIHDNLSGEINAVAEKQTPVDADIALIEDSAAAWGKKKLSWASIKSTLRAYSDTL